MLSRQQKLLYAPMGEFLILQPDEKFSPSHDLLPSGSGLYLLSCSVSDVEPERLIRSAQAVFLSSPHPLEILSDRAAYGSEGTIQRDHDMNSYLKSVRNVIRQELNRIRKARREHRRKLWRQPIAPHGVNAGIIVSRPVASDNMGRGQFNFSSVVQTGRETWKRFSRLVASQHMHLLVVLLFSTRLLMLGTDSLISFHWWSKLVSWCFALKLNVVQWWDDWLVVVNDYLFVTIKSTHVPWTGKLQNCMYKKEVIYINVCFDLWIFIFCKGRSETLRSTKHYIMFTCNLYFSINGAIDMKTAKVHA